MYQVSVETRFNASHQVVLPDGTLELLHGHDWLVRVTFMRPDLDDVGMVVDFDASRRALDDCLLRWRHRNLNEQPELAGKPPTAERLAHAVFDHLARVLRTPIARVDVCEAPGCWASYLAPET